MNTDKHLFLMRNFYTGLQAETMVRYAKVGILNEIEKEKKALSLASGEKNAQMLGVTKPEEAFIKPASIFDCASWEVTRNRNDLKAECSGCKLAAMCKKLGTPSTLPHVLPEPNRRDDKSSEPGSTIYCKIHSLVGRKLYRGSYLVKDHCAWTIDRFHI